MRQTLFCHSRLSWDIRCPALSAEVSKSKAYRGITASPTVRRHHYLPCLLKTLFCPTVSNHQPSRVQLNLTLNYLNLTLNYPNLTLNNLNLTLTRLSPDIIYIQLLSSEVALLYYFDHRLTTTRRLLHAGAERARDR